MEFKGTSGKWKLAYNDYGYYTSVRNLDNTRKVCVSRVNNMIESNANMLLISKAPEMLEMLEKAKSELSRIKGSMMAHPDCTEGSEFDDYTNSAEEVEKEIEQLIKQATEL